MACAVFRIRLGRVPGCHSAYALKQIQWTRNEFGRLFVVHDVRIIQRVEREKAQRFNTHGAF